MNPSSGKHYPARILKRRDISSDLRVFPVGFGGPFKFIAGQHATLGVGRKGHCSERAYSIAFSPYEDLLKFFVELVPHGELILSLFKLNGCAFAGSDAPALIRRTA